MMTTATHWLRAKGLGFCGRVGPSAPRTSTVLFQPEFPNGATQNSKGWQIGISTIGGTGGFQVAREVDLDLQTS